MRDDRSGQLHKNLYGYTVLAMRLKRSLRRGYAREQTVGHPMPEIAAFVAVLKSAFGEREIDEAIRRGKAGEPTFYACENGRSVGTASTPAGADPAHEHPNAAANDAR
ncbi:hypothetical protein SAMN05192539_1007109 [Paraburkholderia diazotrophica]|uniref:Uncharacterized protein n=1 Tax=Paraburkholderia diazotrophica TaxID=667676 RepID=A0A1H6WGA2_9BURK|nr:hypothetical protein SAMN05192539_1007109 [Paraburkholderia diazotrophica]